MAKKVGTKIENDESNFVQPSVGFGLKGKVNWIKLTILVAVIVLTVYAVAKKNLAVGSLALIAGIVLVISPKFTTAKTA